MAQIILPGGRVVDQIVEKVRVTEQAKPAIDETTIRKIGCYKCVATKTQGIYRIVEGKPGFVVRLDFGYVDAPDKTSKEERKKTTRRVDTFEEAYALKTSTTSEKVEGYRKGLTIEDAIEAYKKSTRYLDRLSEGQQDAYDNYFRHAVDGMGGLEPKEITVTRMEEYFKYLLTEGRRGTRKKNDGGPPEGLSVNSISKHKSCLKALWEFIILDKKYGVKDNVAAIAETPMIDIEDEEGRVVKVKKIEVDVQTLSIIQVNDTLNDMLQNEFDRSLVFAFGLGMICGLRRGEILGLKFGRFYHNELITPNVESMCKSKTARLDVDPEYYIKHDELFIVDGQIKRNKGADYFALPKNNKGRVVGKPQVMKEIAEYYMEQRRELADIFHFEFSYNDYMYEPIINTIKGSAARSDKLSKKWLEYQKRRNKRLRLAGKSEMPIIRLHDLRHTFASLLADDVPDKEVSANMGHVYKNANTTTKVYQSQSTPKRNRIIAWMDENIKLDWDKALRVSVNQAGRLELNESGHLLIKKPYEKKLREAGRNLLMTEDEKERLWLPDNHIESLLNSSESI